jgi:hypothetical protein
VEMWLDAYHLEEGRSFPPPCTGSPCVIALLYNRHAILVAGVILRLRQGPRAAAALCPSPRRSWSEQNARHEHKNDQCK